MIRPRRDTPTGRILALICATPGEETIESLAAHVFAPPTPRPFRSYAEIKARAEVLATHVQTSRKKTARIVQHLAEAGYLQSNGRPVVADWFVSKVAAVGLPEALRRAGPRWNRSLANTAPTGPLAFDGYHEGPGVLHAALIDRVTRSVGNPRCTVADIIGTKPTTREQQVWSDLITWGVLIGPRARFPTQKAIDLVASWASSCS